MPSSITSCQFAPCGERFLPARPLLGSRPSPEGKKMNLVVWIPALVLLGLATLGLMFAFVIACDKV